MIYRVVYLELTSAKTWSCYFDDKESAEKHIQWMRSSYRKNIRVEKHAYKEVMWE